MSEFILDGQTYDEASLTDEARSLILALRFVKKEVSNLNRRAGILQTARNAYALELAKHLPQPLTSVEGVEGGVLTVNDRKYARSSLSEVAQANLFSLTEVDRSLESVMDEYAIADTARLTYGQQFKASIESNHLQLQ